MTDGWEHAACAGGVRLTARGQSLAEAFAHTALGVFALIAGPVPIVERERREIRAHGTDVEALLAAWIGECLYLHEVEGFVARRVEFVSFQDGPGAGAEPLRLNAWLHGEDLGETWHALPPPPNPPGANAITVRPMGIGVEVTVALEVSS